MSTTLAGNACALDLRWVREFAADRDRNGFRHMSKKINVLIFPAGEVNAVELHDALSYCVNIEVFGASSVDRHGGYVFKNYISGLPLISDDNFLDEFNKVTASNKIDVVFPTHDSVADYFSKNRQKIKARVIVAGEYTSAVCRDKSMTYRAFRNYPFCPDVYRGAISYPAFVKPVSGQGTVGARLVNKATDLPDNIEEYVVTEYLPGEEYTVDCLTDTCGSLVHISPRSRERTMAGISVAGRTEELTDEIASIANQINAELNFLGLWWFQIKKDINNSWKMLEISTRCAGSMCLTRAKGVNLPLLSVYVVMGQPIKVLDSKYRVQMDRTLISRYKIDYKYSTVYFDFDDTLVIDGEVNLKAIWFLYQCRNEGIRVILLTKHEFDIHETLKKYAISDELFTKVITLPESEYKSDYVAGNQSIFIDNRFAERWEVHKKHGIPVFDVDGVETLMHWRC